MSKQYTASRVVRRSGTKARRHCVTCDGRVARWKWARHIRRHEQKAGRS